MNKLLLKEYFNIKYKKKNRDLKCENDDEMKYLDAERLS